MPTCLTSLHDSVLGEEVHMLCSQCKGASFSVINNTLMCRTCYRREGQLFTKELQELISGIKLDHAGYKDTLCMVLEGVVPILEACAEAVPQYKFSVVQYTIALRGHILELKRK